MKKNNKRAVTKELRKATKKDVETQVLAALSSVVGNLTANPKRIEKIVAKHAKQLAKKITKSLPLTAAKPAIQAPSNNNTAETSTKN